MCQGEQVCTRGPSSHDAVSKEVEGLKNAQTKGEADYATFKRERLESNEPTKKFHDSMKKASLKTFGSAANKRRTKCADMVGQSS